MKKLEIKITVHTYDSEEELQKNDQLLIREAREISSHAYAPYSNFFVGAAIRLSNGEIVTGNNQENAAYPSGICAERVAAFYAGSRFSGINMETICITAQSPNFIINEPIPPCGACRQVLLEYETRQEKNIRVLLTGKSGKIYEIDGIKSLMPLVFSAKDLFGPK